MSNNSKQTCAICGYTLFLKDWPNMRSTQIPLLLTCGHSACRKCLNSYANLGQHITCQQCDSVIVMTKNTDVETQFPINFYLLGLLLYKEASFLQNRYGNAHFVPAGASVSNNRRRPAMAVRPLSHKRNNVCFECSSYGAVCRCEQCDTIYCNGCFLAVHQNGRALRSHTRVNLSDRPEHPFLLGSCSSHPDTENTYFCEDDSSLSCSTCALRKHSGHKLTLLVEKNKELLPEVQRTAASVSKVLKKLIQARKELQVLRPGAKSETLLKIRQQVATHFTRLHGWLQMYEQKLTTELDVGRLGCFEAVDTMSSELEEQVKKTQEMLKIAQRTTDPLLLPRVDMTKLLKDLNDTMSLPCQLVVPENASFDVKFEVLTEMLQFLETHCALQVTSAAPPVLMSLLPEDIERLENTSAETVNIMKPAPSNSNNPFLELIERHASPVPVASTNPFTQTDVSIPSTNPFSPVSAKSPPTPSSYIDRTTIMQPIWPTNWEGEYVKLSCVYSPSDFFVQNKAELPKIEKLKADLNQVARGCQIFHTPKKGALCMIQATNNDFWYRGRIRDIIQNEKKETVCQIFCIDFGNTEEVLSTRVFTLPQQLCAQPPFCKHCLLANIEPVGNEWSLEAITLFQGLTSKRRVQMHVLGVRGNSLEVNLLILNTDEVDSIYEPLSMRDTLLFLNHGNLVQPQDPETKESRRVRTYRSYPSGHFNLIAGSSVEVVVSHIDSPRCFYVQRFGQHSSKLTELMNCLKKYYEKPDPNFNIYYPQIGMCCVAKFSEDSNWYRAIVTGIPERRMVSVFYVDYGNSEIIEWDKIKKLHDKFFKLDIQAIKCKLHDLELPSGIQGWSEDACLHFRSICYNKLLRMTVHKRDSSIFTISLFERRGNEDKSIAIAMAVAGYGMCSRKRKSIFDNSSISGPGPVQKRAYSNAQKYYESKIAFLDASAVETRNKVGRGNHTPFLTIAPSTRTNPSCPVEAILPQSMISPRKEEPPPPPRDDPFRIPVDMISYDSPGVMYLRFISEEPHIMKILDNMQAYFNNLPAELEPKEWEKGQLCAARKANDETWFRAVIEEKRDNGDIEVFLVDTASTVNAVELRRLPDQYLKVIYGAVKCHMAGIKAAGDKNVWPVLAREKLADLLTLYDTIYMTKQGDVEDNSMPVELWVEDIIESGALKPVIKEWSTLNRKLVEMGVAIPIKSAQQLSLTVHASQVLKELMQNMRARFNLPSTPSPPNDDDVLLVHESEIEDENSSLNSLVEPMLVDIPVVDLFSDGKSRSAQWLEPELPQKLTFSAKTTYVDEDGCFFVQEQPKSEKILLRVQKIIQSHYIDTVPTPEDMIWSVGQICVARYHVDNDWYRAIVLEIMDDKCDELKVQFVDYGNIEVVSVTDTRKAAFVTSVPVQSFKCMFSGIVPMGQDKMWSTEDLDIIHGSMVDKKCKIILEEFPKPGEIVKVASLVTELNRDMVEYLVSIDKAKFLDEIPILSISDDDSKEMEIEPIQLSPMKCSKKTCELDQHSQEKLLSLYGADNSEPMQGIEIVSETSAVSIIQEVTTNETVSCSINEENIEDMESGEDKIGKDMSQQPSESGIQMQTSKEQQERTDDIIYIVMSSEDLSDSGTKRDDQMLDQQDQNMNVTNSVHEIMSEQNKIVTVDVDDDITVIDVDVNKGTNLDIRQICLLSDNETEASEASSDLRNLPLDVEDKFISLIIEENTPLLMEVSTVINAVEFFVRPSFILDKSDPLELLAKEMSMDAAKLPLLQNVAVGQACCAKYGNEYYRAAIIDVAADCKTATVAFVDYGNVEALPVSKLRELKDSWYALPRQAVKCVASGIQVVSGVNEQLLDEELCNALQSGPIFVVFKKRSEPCQVQLLAQDQDTSVYAKMLEMKLVEAIPEDKN